MQKFVFLLLLFLSNYAAFGQSVQVTGKIVDATGGLPSAALVFTSIPDSIKRFTTSATDGSFSLELPGNKSWILQISYLGYSPFSKTFQTTNQPLNLGTLSLQTEEILLNETKIVDKLPLATQKGDTTSFNADAFKTNPDANAEDLIKKMPTISSDGGTLKAQGEDVKRVLVDGKPFFGDDPNMALKNLPADVIQRVEVFDDASEQTKFTGVDDGNSIKTINIVTKPNKRNGLFGRVYGGYGLPPHKYQGGGILNYFKKDRRISILGISNNINLQNFSEEDLTSAFSGGGNRGGRGGGMGMMGGGGGRPGRNPAENLLVTPRGGITTTHAVGINYSDTWGKKINVTGSYFFNYSTTNSIQNLRREFFLQGDSLQTYQENNTSVSDNFNHRFTFRFEYNIDTNNTIIFRPVISFQDNRVRSAVSGTTFLGNSLLSNTNNLYDYSSLGLNYTGDLLYRHRFKKEGRTFSINFNSGYNWGQNDGNLFAVNNRYENMLLLTDTIDQQSAYDGAGYTLGSRIEYTEPLSKKSLLSFYYNPSYQFAYADRYTRALDSLTQSYTRIDSVLSNSLNNRYLTQRGGIAYRFTTDKVTFMVSAAYQYATLDVRNEFPFINRINTGFHNILPMAMLNVKFNKSSNLRMFYRSNTDLPTSQQLLSSVDNSNPILLQTGNPDLNQSWNHRLVIRYGNTNTDKATALFVIGRFTFESDYIGNSTIIANSDTTVFGNIFIPQGSQITRPQNFGYRFTASGIITYGFPIKAIKSNMSVEAAADYSLTPSLLNGEVNNSNVTNVGAGISLSSNIGPKIDFRIATRPSYNVVTNSLRANLNNNFFRLFNELAVNYNFWKGFYVETQINHQFFNGLSANVDPNIFLWNGAVGYKFFKDKSLDLRVSVFDILNINTSVRRNTAETYVEDVQTNVLNRFFMLTLTWKFGKFGLGNSTSNPTQNSGMPH